MQTLAPQNGCTTESCQTVFPPDVELYNLQDAAFFNAAGISILVECPPGYQCPPGMFPRTVYYPPGTFIIPDPNTGPGFPVYLTLQGCQSLVTRWLPAGSTEAEVSAAAQEIIQEVATQQAYCDSITSLNPNPTVAYTNDEVYSSIACDECQVPYYTDTLPNYITLDSTNSRLVFAAGIIGANTKAEANSQAQEFIDTFKTDSIDDGSLICLECVITTSSPLTNGTVGSPYSETLAVVDTLTTPVWSVDAGALPDGLSLNSATGEISGTPTTEESSAFTIKVTNGDQCCTKNFALDIDPAAVCVDWNQLLWSSGAMFNGTFSPTSSYANWFNSHTNGDVAVASNTALINYDGPGCDAQCDITISGGSLPNNGTCKFSFAKVSPFTAYVCFAAFGTAPGIYNVPFSLPDTGGVMTQFRVIVAFQSDPGSPPTSFQGILSNV